MLSQPVRKLGQKGLKRCIATDSAGEGKLNTPPLDLVNGAIGNISTAFATPQDKKVPVLELACQVETNLGTYQSRRKTSDFSNLVLLFEKYWQHIREWSMHLDEKLRMEFFIIVQVERKSKASGITEMRKILSLDNPTED